MSQRDPDQRPQPKSRAAFRHFTSCDTRWRDNDRYGHLNNAIYYELFDSAINQLLIDHGLLDFEAGDHVFWWRRRDAIILVKLPIQISWKLASPSAIGQ